VDGASRNQVDVSRRRIEMLVRTLANSPDSESRRSARELLQAALDLHGLALARITASLAESDAGRAVYRALGQDEYVKAVFLLHGLHPDSVEERVERVIGQTLERFPGAAARLVEVSAGIARLAVAPGPYPAEEVHRCLGDGLFEEAPDLDDVAFENLLGDFAGAPGEEARP
jgi:hypothetical protein